MLRIIYYIALCREGMLLLSAKVTKTVPFSEGSSALLSTTKMAETRAWSCKKAAALFLAFYMTEMN
jgi:hypothetical protein